MSVLFHELVQRTAERKADAPALKHREIRCDYGALQLACERFANSLIDLGIKRHDRIAIYLPKQIETVVAIFGAARAGCVFVPINPGLKPAQVRHILRDSGASVLVTSTQRLSALHDALEDCEGLAHIVTVGPSTEQFAKPKPHLHSWNDIVATNSTANKCHRVIDTDVAAILYTSGSTGSPKGVVLSHRNLVAGATSVAEYLENTCNDRLLAVLPLSFDYGLSQLSTAFHVGASVVLLDHLFAKDIIAALSAEKITGLAAVPPLWNQLADISWPEDVRDSLRYVTNSGGAMPATTLAKLRQQLPSTKIFLMYGLTEAFRSTYLPPDEIDSKPGSIGKAIPNAEVLVVRPNGSECDADEPGELVHCGSLVAMGYWNAPDLTSLRFRAAPVKMKELTLPSIAVWSGDTVKRDADGYLYFIGRQDDMIKTSGYRVSPTEIEEVVLQTALVSEAVAFGVNHAALGQAIAVVVVARDARNRSDQALLTACREALPLYMVPLHIEWRDSLPRNPNGKYDRKALSLEFGELFKDAL